MNFNEKLFKWMALSFTSMTLASASALAADFTHGVSGSDSSAKIWFQSSVATTWAIAHYQVEGGDQLNVTMPYVASASRYEVPISGAANGRKLTYSFTYNNGNPAYDTPQYSATIGNTTNPPPTPTGTACFYENADYQGASFCSDADNGWVGTAWNDRITSVKVKSGYQVDLFDDANFGGRKLTVSGDTANLAGQNFNDLVSSFRVRQAGNNGGDTDLPVGSGVMTIKLANNTGGAFADNQIYWTIIGYDPATKALSHVDSSGRLLRSSVGDNDAAGHLVKNGQNYPNYFYRLSDTNWVSVPKIDSARMFISLGSPMYIKINQAIDGVLGFAGPDLNNPTDPNQDVNFEWMELTIDNSGYHGNPTRVDQFGFPVTARLLGKDGFDRTVGDNASRAQIFADFEALPQTEFRALVQRPYRIVAPAKSVFGTGRAQGNYFNAYVDRVWSHYSNTDLLFSTEAGTFRGRVIGNDFVFSKNGGPQNLYIHGKPNTTEVFEGSGNLASGNAEEKVVQAQIMAAFNRHLLIDVDPSQWDNSGSYYKSGPTNYYAKFWHDHGIDGLAYGFSYDDVRNKSTLQEHPNPRGMIVTVGW